MLHPLDVKSLSGLPSHKRRSRTSRSSFCGTSSLPCAGRSNRPSRTSAWQRYADQLHSIRPTGEEIRQANLGNFGALHQCLDYVVARSPFRIEAIQTDNGSVPMALTLDRRIGARDRAPPSGRTIVNQAALLQHMCPPPLLPRVEATGGKSRSLAVSPPVTVIW